MKKWVSFLAGVVILAGFTSCKDDRDDYAEITEVNKIKVDSVKVVSDTMNVNEIQSIIAYSTYLRNCEGSYGFDYDRDDFDRYVTSYKFKVDATCGDSAVGGIRINFNPQTAGTYTFKFWQNDGPADNPVYLEKTIVVE